MGKAINVLYPYLFSLLLTILFIYLGFDHQVNNFDEVLNGAITFSSIVVGFLGALLGILVSIKDSAIVVTIFSSNNKGYLKYYFNEAYVIGFLSVLLSCVMHVLREVDGQTTTIVFCLWLFITLLFIPATYRIVSVLMGVFFRANISNAGVRPESNRISDEEQREEIRRNLSQNQN